MRIKTKILCISLCFALLSAGCGSSAVLSEEETAAASYDLRDYDIESYDTVYETETEYEYAVTEDSESAYVSTGTGDVEAGTDSDGTLSEEKLIYTCYITLETTEYDAASGEIRSLIESYEGFIETESEYNSNYSWYDESASQDDRYLSLTVRIPSAQYSSFLDELGELAQVMYKESSIENITEEYNENSQVIEALEIELDRLMEMMDEAETIEDMIAVEERLTEVETQLNQAKNTQSSMDSDITYSTVYIDLEEVNEYTVSSGDLTYGQRLLKAIRDSFSDLLALFRNGFVFLIYILPFAAVIAVIAAALILILRKFKKRRAAKRGAAAGGPSPGTGCSEDPDKNNESDTGF